MDSEDIREDILILAFIRTILSSPERERSVYFSVWLAPRQLRWDMYVAGLKLGKVCNCRYS